MVEGSANGAPGMRFLAALIACTVVAPHAFAQDYEDIQWKSQRNPDGFTFSYPAPWVVTKEPGFEAVIQASDESAYCTIKRTKDWSFDILTAKEFVQKRIEERKEFVEMLPLQYPDGNGKLIALKEFPFSLQTGLMIITAGKMQGQDIVNSVFQTINGGALFTISCLTIPENYNYYFPIFTQIADRFRFDGQELFEIVRDGDYSDVKQALAQRRWTHFDISKALLAAAEFNRLAAARLLLEAGADPNFQM